MDEAVALVVAAPVVALALWAVAFVGGFANGQARAAVAAELAAQEAVQAGGPKQPTPPRGSLSGRRSPLASGPARL